MEILYLFFVRGWRAVTHSRDRHKKKEARNLRAQFRDAGKSFLPLFVDDKVRLIKSTFFCPPFVSPFKHVSGPASNVKRIKFIFIFLRFQFAFWLFSAFWWVPSVAYNYRTDVGCCGENWFICLLSDSSAFLVVSFFWKKLKKPQFKFRPAQKFVNNSNLIACAQNNSDDEAPKFTERNPNFTLNLRSIVE